MFEVQSKADILARLKQSLSSSISTVEGTFSADITSATSIEFEKAYAELQLVLEAGFSLTSWGEWLTKKCAELGVDRKEATKAHGIVTVTGNAGSKIIKGSLFATENSTNFYTVTDVIINAGGSVNVTIEAALAGTVGNVGIGEINKIPMSIPGVTAVTNAAETYDGFEEESDESLLERYLIKVRTPATSGNKYHYLQWAREVPGVGQAKVVPLWNGNGTVKVIIVNANGEEASADLITAVYEHIEELRPIGAIVTVVSAAPKQITITSNVIRDNSLSLQEIENLLTEKVTVLFNKEGFTSTYISLAKIGKLLLECTGVEDYLELKLNSVAENILINADEIPVLAGVTLNDPQ